MLPTVQSYRFILGSIAVYMGIQKEIKVGELVADGKEVILKSAGIGSCVVICLYDRTARVGGMAHAMLPSRASYKGVAKNEDENCLSGKYADEAVLNLVESLTKLGANKDRITAKLVGGAGLFTSMNSQIGLENVKQVKKTLELVGIPVVAEDTGGRVGRSATFYLNNGIVEVMVKM